jgi:hypothetical protein
VKLWRRLPVGVALVVVAVGIPAALAIDVSGTITNSDPTQVGIHTNHVLSTCATEAVGAQSGSGSIHYDKFRFQNTGGASTCVSVSVDPNCGGGPVNGNSIRSAAYTPNFNAADIVQNLVADIGTNVNLLNGTILYAFDLAAGAFLDVTAYEASAGVGCPNGYTLHVTADPDTLVAVPTAVVAASLSAARTPGAVVVRWRTGSEAEILGFHVYREHGASRVRLDRRLIPAKGAVGGAWYSWVDRRAPARPTRYWVEMVGRNALRMLHGPVTAARA